MTTSTALTTQVHQIYINTTAQRLWDAITGSEWSTRYGYAALTEYDLRAGGRYAVAATEEMRAHGAPEIIIQGEVLEADPPRKLVQTWHALFSPATAAEGPRRLTWEIDEVSDGVCRLTVTHDVTDAPETASLIAGTSPQAGGGWAMIISDLKSLLETGSSMFAKGA
ncbi:MAG TPA: SRPBCC family protein [Pseudonocardiaceae bacterium]